MHPATDRVVRRGAATVALSGVLIVIITVVTALNPGASNWLRARMGWSTPGFVTGAASRLSPVLYDDARLTTLIFVTSGCDACRRAQSFHQELVSLAATRPDLRVRVLMTSPTDDPGAYAGQLAMPAALVQRFDARGTLLRRVPTILVLDRGGVVREMTEGVLSLAEQHALVAKITRYLP